MIGFVLFLLVKTIDKTAAMIAMAFWLFYPGTIIASNLLCTEISFVLLSISAAALVKAIFPELPGKQKFFVVVHGRFMRYLSRPLSGRQHSS